MRKIKIAGLSLFNGHARMYFSFLRNSPMFDLVVYGKGYMIETLEGKPTYSLLAEMKEGTPSYTLGKLSVGVYNIAWVF